MSSTDSEQDRRASKCRVKGRAIAASATIMMPGQQQRRGGCSRAAFHADVGGRRGLADTLFQGSNALQRQLRCRFLIDRKKGNHETAKSIDRGSNGGCFLVSLMFWQGRPISPLCPVLSCCSVVSLNTRNPLGWLTKVSINPSPMYKLFLRSISQTPSTHVHTHPHMLAHADGGASRWVSSAAKPKYPGASNAYCFSPPCRTSSWSGSMRCSSSLASSPEGAKRILLRVMGETSGLSTFHSSWKAEPV